MLVPALPPACLQGLDLSCIRAWSSTGEASAPDDVHWLMALVRGYRPVIEYCGGEHGNALYCRLHALGHACSRAFHADRCTCDQLRATFACVARRAQHAYQLNRKEPSWGLDGGQL